MRDEHERGAEFMVQIKEQLLNRAPVVAIEVASGFVSEEDFGLVNKSPSECDALLLASRKLNRVVIYAGGKAHFIEETLGLGFSVATAEQVDRHGDVFQRRERGYQLKILKDEADLLPPQSGAGVFVQIFQRCAEQAYAARSRQVEPRAKAEKRGLTTARWPDNGEALTRREAEFDLGEHRQLTLARGVGFR